MANNTIWCFKLSALAFGACGSPLGNASYPKESQYQVGRYSIRYDWIQYTIMGQGMIMSSVLSHITELLKTRQASHSFLLMASEPATLPQILTDMTEKQTYNKLKVISLPCLVRGKPEFPIWTLHHHTPSFIIRENYPELSKIYLIVISQHMYTEQKCECRWKGKINITFTYYVEV